MAPATLTRAARDELDDLLAELEARRTPTDLHPKQRVAFESDATEELYGGAAGGGKSHLMRRAAITWCTWVPGLQVYIFRREFSDLYKNHMEGPSGFPAMLAGEIARGAARIVWSKNQIRFRNGSVIHLCHCQHEKDVYGYQGAEIHVLVIDELTQWSRKMYTFLRSRLRIGGLKVPAWLQARFPRILLGANPGGIGHNWVKGDFIDLAPAYTITPMPKSEGGMLRQFIPALLEDNPSMTENDPDYEGRLEGLDDKVLARAMRKGDWDIVAGGMFDDLWLRSRHAIAPFPIPRSWRIDRAFDWGSSKPFSVGWWAESDGTPATLADGSQRTFPRGTLFRIAEWYGCVPSRPNEGLRMLAVEVARGIKQREREDPALVHRHVEPGPADTSIFDVENGNSIAADMKRAGVEWTEADKSPGSRKTGWEALRKRLAYARPDRTAGKGYGEEPALYVFETCVDWIRTVPVLPRDERDRDDVDTKAEDHTGDETRYRLLAPRRAAWTTVPVAR